MRGAENLRIPAETKEKQMVQSVIRRSDTETYERRSSTLVSRAWADRMHAGCLEWEDEQYHRAPLRNQGLWEKSSRLTEIKHKETDTALTAACEKMNVHYRS